SPSPAPWRRRRHAEEQHHQKKPRRNPVDPLLLPRRSYELLPPYWYWRSAVAPRPTPHFDKSCPWSFEYPSPVPSTAVPPPADQGEKENALVGYVPKRHSNL